MEHTKEPWYFDNKTDEITCKSRKNKVAIAAVETGFSEPFESEQRANARRIVACVNACAGITTEDLEKTPKFSSLYVEALASGDVQNFGLTTALVAAIERNLSLKKQRDELLEALISAVEDEPNACFAEHARSVIAKASGETK